MWPPISWTVNNTMTNYLREDRFRTLPGAMVYVERTISTGKVRRGLLGKVDLEAYDYESGPAAPVRATEGVVLSRIPPRVAVRKNASLELPHAMLLLDDPEDRLMDYLAARTGDMEPLYDFQLMENGGHIRGWRLTEAHLAETARLLRAVTDPEAFRARYGTEDYIALAVGDGNHSLATAKECYERQKRFTPQEQWEDLPARYALVELTNLHDRSLEFRPVHRVLFGVEPAEVLAALVSAFPGAHYGRGRGTELLCPHRGSRVRHRAPSGGPDRDRHSPDLPGRLYAPLGRAHRLYPRRGCGPGPGRPARGTWPSSCLRWRRSRCYRRCSTMESCPVRPSLWGRPRDKRFYLEARKIR